MPKNVFNSTHFSEPKPGFNPKKHRLLVIDKDTRLFKSPYLITLEDDGLDQLIEQADNGRCMLIDLYSMQRYYQGTWKYIEVFHD